MLTSQSTYTILYSILWSSKIKELFKLFILWCCGIQVHNLSVYWLINPTISFSYQIWIYFLVRVRRRRTALSVSCPSLGFFEKSCPCLPKKYTPLPLCRAGQRQDRAVRTFGVVVRRCLGTVESGQNRWNLEICLSCWRPILFKKSPTWL